MSKLLLLVLVAVIAYVIVKAVLRVRSGRDDAPRVAAPEPMVACAQCGVNVPLSEAVGARGRYFCCEDHERLAAR